MSNKEPYAMMYKSVVMDKRISDKDFRILAFIKSFSDNWRVYQNHIAKELGISASTVVRIINRLDAAGYLTYERTATKIGSERRNVKMLKKPQHWNEVEPRKVSPKAMKAPKSKLTANPVKNDMPSLSNLTPNEELTETSYAEVNTKRHDAVASGEDDSAAALWTRYNSVPEGYLPIDPAELSPDDRDQALRMYEDMQNTHAGLRQAAGEKDECGLDADYYKASVRLALDPNGLSLALPPKMFVQVIGEGGIAVYARSSLVSC